MHASEMVNQYLRRIAFEGKPTVSYDTLGRLQYQHLLYIPYENLDITRGVPLSLDTALLFDKIVTRERGGYCFELNGLFAWLLRSLGFTVVEYMARFLRDETEIPMRRHRVLRVSCMGTDYLADVGVGGIIPRKPLPLVCKKINRQGEEKYKLTQEPFWGYVLHEWRRGAWRRLYAFTAEEQLPIDFVMPSFYCENHPDSIFRTADMVHIFTADGRKSIANRECRIFTPGGVSVVKPDSDEAYAAILRKHFGIVI